MKKRFVALTDIYLRSAEQKEVDDIESMVRLLLYSNEIDIEGLVATSSFCLHDGGTEAEKKVILDIIDAYEKILPNLRSHDANYPDADKLRAVTAHGITGYGKKPGDGFAHEKYKGNEGVRVILDAINRTDERPVWFGLWGGANTLAQAIWELWQERSSEEFDRLIRKIRVYGISDQDHAGIWLRRKFGDRLFYIVSPSNGSSSNVLNGLGMMNAAWTGMCWDAYFPGQMKQIKPKFEAADTYLASPEWLKENICGDSPYRKMYPIPAAAMEGDTPSYLGLIPNGLNEMEHPDWGSWGGRYEYKKPEKYAPLTKHEKFPIWTDCEDSYTGSNGKTVTNNVCTIYRWREAVQNDFAGRMAWTETAEYYKANHPPVVKLDTPNELSVRIGEKVVLSAQGSTDPDGDTLSFHWFNYREAGNYSQIIEIPEANKASCCFTAPDRACRLHFIVEVKDSGVPSLTRYRRVIVHVSE